MEVTRFAPSPNGPLHLGHALSAIVAHDLAAARGGRFVLRIEDLDPQRSRAEYAAQARADLAWLGLVWHEVAPQSTRHAAYAAAAARLRDDGLLYPCTCTRSAIAAAATASGPEGPIYPGTCKGRLAVPAGAVAWRLDMAEALRRAGPLTWEDELAGEQIADPALFGDVVLVPKQAPAAYHLAVVMDDAADAVTCVTRGRDLFLASHVHRLLQALLELPVPRWHHHALVLDRDGAKLAKTRGSPSLAARRAAGEDGAALATALRQGQLKAGHSLG